jgi:hypothetical protein
MKKYLVCVSVVSSFTVEVEADDEAIAEEMALDSEFEDFLRPKDYELEVLDIEEIEQ